MRRGLVVASLVGCSVATPPSPPSLTPSPPAVEPPSVTAHRGTPCDERWVAATLTRVGRLRGRPPKHAVPCVKLARRDLLALVREHITREVPPAAIRAEGVEHKLLGLFPATANYEKVTFALLEGELAGYYEPADGTMYMASDLDKEDASSTLSHELVHALQDQYWDLKSRSTYMPGQDDRTSALSALAEGDATSAMEDQALDGAPGRSALDEPDDALARRMLTSVSSGSGSAAPRALQRELIAPYVDGTIFVHALRRKAGWGAVDEAWSSLPTTTEQVLHPDKWRSHEPALVVVTPPPPEPEGFTLTDDDTLGEEGFRLTLEEWMPAGIAATSASGWGGDRLALYTNARGKVALAWDIRFDEAHDAPFDAFAKRAFIALSAMAANLGAAFVTSPDAVCVERAGNGVLVVTRAGRDVVLVVGTASLSAEGLTPVMRCDAAVAWGRRIAAPEAR